jgi:cytochrome c peroxidase
MLETANVGADGTGGRAKTMAVRFVWTGCKDLPMVRKRATQLWGAALCAAMTASGAIAAERDPHSLMQTARLRHPVAAVFLDNGQTLCVANGRAGTLSLVDVSLGLVRAELEIGERLAGLAVLPDRRHVLVVDERRHELIALTFDGARMKVCARMPVSPYPVSITVEPDGTRAMIAGLWSRSLDVVEVSAPSPKANSISLRMLHTIHLPLAPREQCVLPGRPYVLVADAFGGHLAVVDFVTGQVRAVHALDGHNLRGMVLGPSGKELLVSHQILNQHAATTRENIQRGVLMANVVQVLPLDCLLMPGAKLEGSGQLLHLGTPGAGAGDPAGLAVLDGERFVVALAGVNELALVRMCGETVWRLPVGCRPTAVVPAGAGFVVVVNTFGNSVSVVDVRRDLVMRSINLGPPPRLDPQERGEQLFFDARLGRDGWLSCHSCHSDGHTNGLLADTLGDKTYGTPKRTLTLLNTALTDPWAWNGEMKYLHDQVRHSLDETMHARFVTAEQVDDLVSFLHTLPPPPPLNPLGKDEADRRQIERGRQIFQERGCVHCHIPPLTYSSHETYDVGFADERGLRRFNPPSLRGVGQGYRFFHDNRAANLGEVFTRFHHKVGKETAPSELADLSRFLRTL